MTARPSIRDWPEGERPREKLIQCGAETLTDAELLAILLRVGNIRLPSAIVGFYTVNPGSFL